jgi:hypothetical protein
MLSDSIRRISRNTDDSDAALFCSLKIDVVEARAAQKDQFNAAFFEGLNSSSRSFVIYEDADSVISLCEVRCFRCKTSLEILDIAVISSFALILSKLTEEDTVIILCSEESDL